ncbi:MAG TPA: helix-turn-helix domain-containing protein, partial [Streptosporangiaceae bacterium]|nr:helix-turn-helix domain-containing protein [Streptosporangiaceae bacterium]
MNATVVSLQDARPRGRWAIESALAESDLPAPARLVLYDLLRRSDASTAVIPERFSPSIAAIAQATGLSTATVKRALNSAEQAGWVTRTRHPHQSRDHDPTSYAIHTPLGWLTESQGLAHTEPGVGSQ